MSDPTPPVVILDKSQMAENIGAVARVMANFGLSELRLVAPRDGWPQERAWPTASGADWVLDFHKAAAPVRTASVWQVREPLYQRSSGRWRNYAKHLDGVRAALGT